jgi:hypothetical protein
MSHVIFLKYISLKTYLVFSANYYTTFFLNIITVFTVGYFGRVSFKVLLDLPVLDSLFSSFLL